MSEVLLSTGWFLDSFCQLEDFRGSKEFRKYLVRYGPVLPDWFPRNNQSPVCFSLF